MTLINRYGEIKMESAAEWIDIDELKEWDQNPRVNEHAIDEVAKSIKRFGFASPIIARKEDNTIIAGHTRWQAARSLGLDKVPVRFMDLDPADAKLLAIADNKLGEYANWNDELLSEVLSDLSDYGADLIETGFSEQELEELLNFNIEENENSELDFGHQEETDEYDDLPEISESIFKSGDDINVGNHRIICGDCIEVLKKMPDESVDSIVTDPPYGIDYMARKWDASTPQNQWASECFRVLKHGGHIISFGATRTIHRVTTVLENSGFEIRDTISWVYESGFPKSKNLSKSIDSYYNMERPVVAQQKVTGTAKPSIGKKGHNASYTRSAKFEDREDNPLYIAITKPVSEDAIKWDGWGTSLKPAQEPAILARKPIKEKSVTENVIKHGVGGINIDSCRFVYNDPCWIGKYTDKPKDYIRGPQGGHFRDTQVMKITGEEEISEATDFRNQPLLANDVGRFPANVFYCKKPNVKEREMGCESLTKKSSRGHMNVNNGSGERFDGGPTPKRGNNHPTVKPIKLMNWLVKLVTPVNGVVLDTYCGSGTTMVAAEIAGIKSIGIELNPEYCDIIYARLKHTLED